MPATQDHKCVGHNLRLEREKLHNSKIQEAPDVNLRVSIRKGPVDVDTSLIELQENYRKSKEWTDVLNNGGTTGATGGVPPGLTVAPEVLLYRANYVRKQVRTPSRKQVRTPCYV